MRRIRENGRQTCDGSSACCEWPDFAAGGGLMSCGNDIAGGYRQADIHAGRILKGEKPGDLPVMQLSKVGLVVNRDRMRECGSECEQRNIEGTRRGSHAIVIGGQLDRLPLATQELDRGEMHRVERSQPRWERFDGSGEYDRSQFDQCQPIDQGPCAVAMRTRVSARMQAVPDLVFEQSARNKRLLLEEIRRCAVLRQQMRQGDRAIEIDHRSSRSCRSSASSVSRRTTGWRGGGPLPGIAGGRNQPRRTASASSGLRPARGGTNSATTRSRSVTRTVSPLATKRTYSLSRFFRVLRPTARIHNNVASSSYLRKAMARADEVLE